ncbi:hypothetical protein Taro_024917 [Colocasia esculenta]|uniref:Carbohydrate kinase PfkB domain-containing protein n=1 Tax=Colocasia esculenta TaxID=4460 RepID=A0A843VIY5_COLES|nr:hypothetical protein [Colocasia esculenta]
MGVAPAPMDDAVRRTAEAEQPPPLLSGLVVGNYCHDVLFRDDVLIGESLGGAASFISNVFDAIGCRHGCIYVSKVGPDFAYSSQSLPAPFFSASSPTTLFHAHFFSSYSSEDVAYHGDRVLKRVHACDPVSPSDIPEGEGEGEGGTPLFEFGLAVGVAGEISPPTLARMIDVCRVVFVDVQALIRTFDPIDGTVGLVPLRDTGFFHLLPRIGFLKASADEAPFVDIEEVRKSCCVVVTDGKDGCRVYSESGVLRVPPFPAVQLDPTGAGDSFLGGFVAGMIHGLTVPDAALLGNFFGSLTVGQIGVPKFHHEMLQVPLSFPSQTVDVFFLLSLP